VTKADIADKGAVIIWPATDTAGRPPPDVARQFPDLATEVPHAFPRPYQGRMQPLRIGWGMIRPRLQANAPEASPRPAQPEPPPQPVVQSPPQQQPTQPVPQQRPAPRPAPPVAQTQPSPETQPQEVDPQPQVLAPEPPHRRRPRVRPYQNMHTPQ
jgi:hypothetical protein